MSSGSASSEVPQPVWPSADMTDWPLTRITALIYDFLVIVTMVAAFIYWKKRIAAAQAESTEVTPTQGGIRILSHDAQLLPIGSGAGQQQQNSNTMRPTEIDMHPSAKPMLVEQRFILPFKMWRLFSAGYEQVEILGSGGEATAGASGMSVRSTRYRTGDLLGCCLSCCFCNSVFFEQSKTLQSEDGTGISLSSIRRCEYSYDTSRRNCPLITLCFFASCACGLFLHFIPCIWWTCDWGPHDGQGVRGAIWFITWPIICGVMIFLLGHHAVVVGTTDRTYTILGGSQEECLEVQRAISTRMASMNKGPMQGVAL